MYTTKMIIINGQEVIVKVYKTGASGQRTNLTANEIKHQKIKEAQIINKIRQARNIAKKRRLK